MPWGGTENNVWNLDSSLLHSGPPRLLPLRCAMLRCADPGTRCPSLSAPPPPLNHLSGLEESEMLPPLPSRGMPL